jgi:hypothetical protein
MFFILRRIQRDVVLNVKTSSREVLFIFVGFLIELEFFQLSSDKCSKIKFYQNPSSGSRVVPCGRRDMTKLIFAFRSSANAPGNVELCTLTAVKG